MPRGGPRLRTQNNKLNQIGPRARERRQVLHLEQDEVCARVATETRGAWNPGWQDLSRIENGARMVSDLEVLVLAQVLDCSACWLLLGAAEEKIPR
jgi:hypothetical protein